MKKCFSCSIENIFIDLMLPKTKPISIGIIHKDPNQIKFLEQVITKFEELVLKTECYVTRDFIINLLFKGTDTLDKLNEIKKFYKELFSDIRKYAEFCFIRSFEQMINYPTRITCNT